MTCRPGPGHRWRSASSTPQAPPAGRSPAHHRPARPATCRPPATADRRGRRRRAERARRGHRPRPARRRRTGGRPGRAIDPAAGRHRPSRGAVQPDGRSPTPAPSSSAPLGNAVIHVSGYDQAAGGLPTSSPRAGRSRDRRRGSVPDRRSGDLHRRAGALGHHHLRRQPLPAGRQRLHAGSADREQRIPDSSPRWRSTPEAAALDHRGRGPARDAEAHTGSEHRTAPAQRPVAGATTPRRLPSRHPLTGT